MRYGAAGDGFGKGLTSLAGRQKAKLLGDKKIFNQDIEEIIRQEIIS